MSTKISDANLMFKPKIINDKGRVITLLIFAYWRLELMWSSRFSYEGCDFSSSSPWLLHCWKGCNLWSFQRLLQVLPHDTHIPGSWQRIYLCPFITHCGGIYATICAVCLARAWNYRYLQLVHYFSPIQLYGNYIGHCGSSKAVCYPHLISYRYRRNSMIFAM